MLLFAIDPGTSKSAYVQYESDRFPDSPIEDMAIVPNEELLPICRERSAVCEFVIEMVASYGMPVGREVFETVRWIGRFHEAAGEAEYLYRKDVKMHLCQSMRAKDANIRQALLDLFPATGGGATPQVGTQKDRGPLYGVSKDIWSALAVAVTYHQVRADEV